MKQHCLWHETDSGVCGSFVCDIANHISDKAIVRTTIAVAHSINFDVIAEGEEAAVRPALQSVAFSSFGNNEMSGQVQTRHGQPYLI
jgi:predicted signal transduction protein with EAL and GGDEF domain